MTAWPATATRKRTPRAGIAELDRLRVVEQRAEERRAEERHQRPRQARREEVGDEQRGEEQHRLQVAVRAAGGPQGQRDDGHHPRGHARARRGWSSSARSGRARARGRPSPPRSRRARARRRGAAAACPGWRARATPTTAVASHIRPEIEVGQGPVVVERPSVRRRACSCALRPAWSARAPRGLSVRVRRRSRAAAGASRRPAPAAPRRAARAGRRGPRCAPPRTPARRAIAAMSMVSKPGHGAGWPVFGGELVHDRVAAVGHDHEQRADAVARRAPQRLDRVQRRAVADAPRRTGRSGSAMRRPMVPGQGEAEAAHRGAEEAHRHAGRDARVQLGPARGRLLDEDGVGRQALGQRGEDVAGAQRLAGRRAAAARAGVANGPGCGPPRAPAAARPGRGRPRSARPGSSAATGCGAPRRGRR